MAETPQAPPAILGFKGVNNRVDPTRLEWAFALTAENVLCDSAERYVRRPGYAESLTGVADVYGTRAGALLVVMADHRLIEIGASGEAVLRAQGVIGAPFRWAELGYAVFCQSDQAQWAVYPDRTIPWGSLCPTTTPDFGTVPVDTNDLLTLVAPTGKPRYYPPPLGDCIGARRNQLVVSAWEPEKDRSVLYFSLPDAPHCFDLTTFQLVAGRVTLLATVGHVFVIGSDRAIYVEEMGAQPQRVADYGVLPGTGAHWDQGALFFWTDRGLCTAPPFKNLTDEALVPENRVLAAGALLHYQGSSYYLSLQRGDLRTQRAAYSPDSITTTYPQGITP